MYGTTEIIYFTIYNYLKKNEIPKKEKVFAKQKKKKKKKHFVMSLSPIYENCMKIIS